MTTATRSRDSILAELSHGPIRDKSGRATSKLLEATKYKGSLTGLTNLLKKLEQEGLVTRTVNGKRCFEIRSTASVAAGVTPRTCPGSHPLSNPNPKKPGSTSPGWPRRCSTE